MIFAYEKPLNHLLTSGSVYTFREHWHDEGDDWITNRRGGAKLADVSIQLVVVVKNLGQLSFYSHNSGFGSLKEWVTMIQAITEKQLPTGWLYLVRLKTKTVTSLSLRHETISKQRDRQATILLVSFVAALTVTIVFVTVCSNVIDQMVINYKFYEDWRSTSDWELAPGVVVNWWYAFKLAIIGLFVGGALFGFVVFVAVSIICSKLFIQNVT